MTEHLHPHRLPPGGRVETIEGGDIIESVDGDPIGMSRVRRQVFAVDQDRHLAIGFLQPGDGDDD